jgi:hypothetical protein
MGMIGICGLTISIIRGLGKFLPLCFVIFAFSGSANSNSHEYLEWKIDEGRYFKIPKKHIAIFDYHRRTGKIHTLVLTFLLPDLRAIPGGPRVRADRLPPENLLTVSLNRYKPSQKTKDYRKIRDSKNWNEFFDLYAGLDPEAVPDNKDFVSFTEPDSRYNYILPKKNIKFKEQFYFFRCASKKFVRQVCSGGIYHMKHASLQVQLLHHHLKNWLKYELILSNTLDSWVVENENVVP